MLSIDILPVPTDRSGAEEMQNKLLECGNRYASQRLAAGLECRQDFSAVLPYDGMEQQQRKAQEMLEDLTNRDQRMARQSA